MAHETIPQLEDLKRIVRFVHNHLQAGHGLDNEDMLTDLNTLLVDLHRVLDLLGPPASLEARVAWLVRNAVAQNEVLDEILEEVECDVDGSI